MIKFAFIMNIPGENPDTYKGVYENSESYNLLVGANDMEETKELVKNLIKDGFTWFNFCGDYDDEKMEELKKITGPDLKAKGAKYFPKEMEKFEALKSQQDFGIIVQMAGVEENKEVLIENKICNSHAVFVKDMEASKVAAKYLVDKGIDFIELCSWYDDEKTKTIIDSIGGAVPIGSCGIL